MKKTQPASEPDPLADRRLTTEEVAAIYRVTPSTVRTWRERGTGPQPWSKGKRRRALIRESAVRAHLEAEENAVDVYIA